MILGLKIGEIRIFEQKSDNSFIPVPFEMENQDLSVSNIEIDHKKSLIYLGRLSRKIQILDYTNINKIKQIKKSTIRFYSMYEKSFDIKNNSIFGVFNSKRNFSIKEDIKKNKVSIFCTHKDTVTHRSFQNLLINSLPGLLTTPS